MKGTRIRTKFLAFPAICIVVTVVLSLVGLDIVRSQTQLLERLSANDLTKSQNLTLLFDQVSRSHAAVYDLLVEAERGLEEQGVSERGRPLLDSIRSAGKRMEELQAAFAFGADETLLAGVVVAELVAYADGIASALEIASTAPDVSRLLMRQANGDYADLSGAFARLLEESRRATDQAMGDARRETA